MRLKNSSTPVETKLPILFAASRHVTVMRPDNLRRSVQLFYLYCLISERWSCV
jgi:hypothetical protein